MAGFNYAQNIIGIKKGAGDIHELEVEVANLSASVLSIGEDVTSLEPTDIAPLIHVNTDYVSTSNLAITGRKIKDIVIISGRFTVSTEKPAGQTNVLMTGFPAPAPGVIVAINNNGTYGDLIINSDGALTSNLAVPTSTYNINASYVSAT